jgi:DUF3054 family protein
MRARFSFWLFAGDALCLSLFVLAGLETHASTSPLVRFIINAGPLIVTWTLTAWALGALDLEQPLTYRTTLGRTLVAWLVAAPLALIVRAVVLRATTIVLIFMLVTLGLGGLLLLVWRTAAVWLMKRHPA